MGRNTEIWLTTSLRMPSAELERLKERAWQQRKRYSALVREIVIDYLDKLEAEAGTQDAKQ
jgi:predicted DNA-binding protein